MFKSYTTPIELEKEFASLLIKEFQKPGLILLPSGNTFNNIYKLVNEHYQDQQYLSLDFNKSEESYKNIKHQVDPDLRLSHLDEIIKNHNQFFSREIKNKLNNVVIQLKQEFYAVDVNNPDEFDRYIKAKGGPRLIIGGLGANPETAHVAFIGEEFLNSSTSEIKLSKQTAQQHGCSRAVTIGTDIFRANNLEQIYIVVQGEHKAESLKEAQENSDTGLGYLIKNHSDKLSILTDLKAL